MNYRIEAQSKRRIRVRLRNSKLGEEDPALVRPEWNLKKELLSISDCGIAINSGAAIAREIADITISEDDLRALVILKKLSDGLMARIHGNYRRIISFNSFLMLMGALGVFPSATTALLHNISTVGISLNSMTNLLPGKWQDYIFLFRSSIMQSAVTAHAAATFRSPSISWAVSGLRLTFNARRMPGQRPQKTMAGMEI